MKEFWKKLLQNVDDRRDIALPGNKQETIDFCVKHFLSIGNEAIQSRGRFTTALSGGSTPKAIFEELASEKFRSLIDWTKVELYWSDERCVSPTHPDSNYKMAMDAGLGTLPIPEENIHRMRAEGNLEQEAKAYEERIRHHVGNFDLTMLGMGEDGHTASLFPFTHGLHSENRLVIGNYVPEKGVWRMTLTFDCINDSRNIVVYVIGKNKQEMLEIILKGSQDPERLPAQRLGTKRHKALWIADNQASFYEYNTSSINPSL